MKREFTAVFQKRDKWYVAYVEEIPGVNTQGRTEGGAGQSQGGASAYHRGESPAGFQSL